MDSQTPSFCPVTQAQRKTILLLEALGLIHDIGKLSDRFLNAWSKDGKGKEDFSYELFIDPNSIELFAKCCKPKNGDPAFDKIDSWLKTAINPEKCAFSEQPGLTATLNNISITDWHGITYTLAELAPFVMKPGYSKIYTWQAVLGRSMAPGLLIGHMHGVAHIDKEDNTQAKQPYDDLNRATPFGHETRIEKGNSSNTLKNLPVNNLANVTEGIKKRREWLDAMRDGLKQAIADTRRPLNDVTLWDWGYLVASLTKATAHYLFVTTNKDLDFKEIPLIVLRVNIDILALYAQSDRISDLLGKKDDLKKAYEAVREMLEYDLALGNQFYHDETGAYYLLPGGIWTPEKEAALRKEIQKCFPDDLRPRVHLGNPIKAADFDKEHYKDKELNNNKNTENRKAAIREFIAAPRQKALGEPTIQADNNLSLFKEERAWKKFGHAEICSVCGQYPVGYPKDKLDRETSVILAPWATHAKANERHVCCYCLQRRGRRAKEWGKAVADGRIETTVWTDEVADKNGRIALFTGMFEMDPWLNGLELDTTRLSRNAAKNPSPSRLFRIAETTRGFWETLSGEPLIISSEARKHRLRLVPETPEKLDLGSFHTYELLWGSNRIGVVWDGRFFLTTENIEAASRLFGVVANELCSHLKKKPCELRLPSSFGQPGKMVSKTVKFSSVVNAGPYHPAIPLIAEPSLCMALLPADRALDFVEKVLDSYSDEMNRIQDRLPLGIGLVFFPSSTPVRSIMETGRSMLGLLSNNHNETWPIIDDMLTSNQRRFTFENGIKLQFQKMIGENLQVPDEWYLWHHKTGKNGGIKKNDEIKTRDKLRVKPSRFDFEFLDTSGRRFDIAYDQNGRRSTHSRPWYLADVPRLLDLWKKHFIKLSQTQRNQVIGLIETKRREWDIPSKHDVADGKDSPQHDIFRQFVEDTLAGANWPRDHKWDCLPEDVPEQLVNAGVDGTLQDLAELHDFIMKE